MSTFLGFLASLIAIFVFFNYFVWYRLKEDYTSDNVFQSTFATAGFSLVFGALAYFLNNEVWFWGAFLGFLFGIWFSVKKMGFKFYELVEASGVGALAFISLMHLSVYIQTGDLKILIFSAVPILLYLVFFYLDKRYRKFSWYKSGKVGFAGLVVLGIYFLFRAAVAIPFYDMISFVGKMDSVVSAAVSFLFFFAVYSLAEN